MQHKMHVFGLIHKIKRKKQDFFPYATYHNMYHADLQVDQLVDLMVQWSDLILCIGVLALNG
jgi:hypothetical protein